MFMLDHLLKTCICHSNPFFLVSERSGRNRPLREGPCIYHLGISYTTEVALKAAPTPDEGEKP